MKPKIFIDGSAGTTGLQIHERLAARSDIEMLHIAPPKRKDISERKRFVNAADIVFICLPDEAAREAVSLIGNPAVRIIDASSAHRVADGWVYGLPELSEAQKESIRTAARVSNPGCHATGAILLLAPLMQENLIPPGRQISVTSLTGYTGAGKDMINIYENPDRKPGSELDSPRLYAMSARHKHIPEIMRYAGLDAMPVFMPVIADFPQGMQIIIPLSLPGRRKDIFDTLAGHYAGCVNVEVSDSTGTYAPSNAYAGSDKIVLKVLGYDDVVILTAQFDNLGKGAAGAAVQNMNIMLGFNEYEGLIL